MVDMKSKAPIVLGGIAAVGVVAAVVLGSGSAHAAELKPTKKPARKPTKKPARKPDVKPKPRREAPLVDVDVDARRPTVRPERPLPQVEDRPPLRQPGAGEHATLGAPWRPGRANEKRNSVLAVTRGPQSHPVGLRRRDGQPADEWAANVAYWESYPSGPVVIPAGASGAKWAKAWLRCRAYARQAIADVVARRAAEPKSAPAKPKSSPAKPKSSPAKPKSSPAPAPPPPAKLATSKSDLAAAAEKRNSAIAVVSRPKSAQHGGTTVSRTTQSDADWLANIAYWATYPDAPTKIGNPKTDPSQAVWAAAWLRCRDAVQRCIALQKTLAPSPVPALNKMQWELLAMTLATTSGLRSSGAIASAVKAAHAWYADSPAGKDLAKRDLGAQTVSGPVTSSGLLAETATRVPHPETTVAWRKSPSRSFWAANGLF